MKPILLLPESERSAVDFVFTDIDDTLSTEGLLTDGAYSALWRLHRGGVAVIPVTGRPAGWCDHIARFWPVAGVVGENGAVGYAYDREARRMRQLHALGEAERVDGRRRLDELRRRILAEVPGAGVASDQPFRLYDLAIDFREDVPQLSRDQVDRIVQLFEEAGATAKVSSIHVNGWFGDFDKLEMMIRLARDVLALDLEDPADRARTLYVGDSPNDEPAFGFFERSVGVANIRDFDTRLRRPPLYVTDRRGGAGFQELTDLLLDARGPARAPAAPG